MLELNQGGTIEIEQDGAGPPEQVRVTKLDPKQRGWVGLRFRTSIILAGLWVIVLVSELIVALVDHEPPPWHQILLMVVAALSAVFWTVSAVRRVRHDRRPF